MKADLHRQLALRVAQAHLAIGDAQPFSFVSGSTVENLVDERSDVDMSVVLSSLSSRDVLQAACRAAGGTSWNWSIGQPEDGGFVVSFKLEGVEVQIGYATHANLAADLDELLVAHNPDTPNHKLAEGVLKAEPLINEPELRRWQARLADFPQGLREAMVRHALATPTPWRAAAQIIHRDAGLWCREIQVDACYRLLLALCGINRRYFTRFQLKRVHKLAAALGIAPPSLADRMDALLSAPPQQAFDALHALEGEALAFIESELPAVQTAGARQRWSAYG